MEILLSRSWTEEFRFAAQVRREKLLQKDEQLRFEQSERREQQKREAEEKRKDEETSEIIGKIFAPPQAVAAFRDELDRYDTATVEALMENQKALDLVRERLDEMLGRAYVLPDGRRVFRTEDGQRVFDERGQPVSMEVLDPAVISSSSPTWEAYDAVNRERLRLEQERQQLLEYQAKLDEARERLDRGDITQRELDRTREELSAAMPQGIHDRMEAQDPSRSQAGPSPAASVVPLPDNMDDLMRRTGFGTSAPAI